MSETKTWQPGPDDTPEGSIAAAFSMWASEFAIGHDENAAIEAERDWAIATLREQAATEARRDLLAKVEGLRDRYDDHALASVGDQEHRYEIRTAALDVVLRLIEEEP